MKKKKEDKKKMDDDDHLNEDEQPKPQSQVPVAIIKSHSRSSCKIAQHYSKMVG